MKFLKRVVIVLLLLSTLGYGSYAFGRYILSNHLFGPSLKDNGKSDTTVVNASVTRQTKIKEGPPRVDVEVLPAESAGGGPPPPPTEVLRERAREINPNPSAPESSLSASRDSNDDNTVAPTPKPLGQREFDDAPGVRSNKARPEARPERTRRRRRRRTRTTAAPAAAPSTSSSDSAPSRADSSSNDSSSSSGSASSNDNGSSRSTSSSDEGAANGSSSSGSTSSGSSSSERSTRRPQSSSRPPVRSAPRPERSTRESPIPRPERSNERPARSDSESPIPRPE